MTLDCHAPLAMTTKTVKGITNGYLFSYGMILIYGTPTVWSRLFF